MPITAGTHSEGCLMLSSFCTASLRTGIMRASTNFSGFSIVRDSYTTPFLNAEWKSVFEQNIQVLHGNLGSWKGYKFWPPDFHLHQLEQCHFIFCVPQNCIFRSQESEEKMLNNRLRLCKKKIPRHFEWSFMSNVWPVGLRLRGLTDNFWLCFAELGINWRLKVSFWTTDFRIVERHIANEKNFFLSMEFWFWALWGLTEFCNLIGRIFRVDSRISH